MMFLNPVWRHPPLLPHLLVKSHTIGPIKEDFREISNPQGFETNTSYMLPSLLNAGAQGYGLELHRDRLTVHYKQDARHSSDVGSIQADKPIPLNQVLYYFEATVLEPGNHGRIAIGFTDQNFKLTKQPG
jgi:hypothetical protein